MRVEADLAGSPFELEDRNWAVGDLLGGGAAMDAKERDLAAARERFEVAARVGNAIDFVKRIGQKGSPKRACQIDAEESNNNASDQTAERSSRAKRNAPCTPRHSRKRIVRRKC